ncbi:MAG: hypothetical protein WCK58_04120 [Chloroflexota bacterium]
MPLVMDVSGASLSMPALYAAMGMAMSGAGGAPSVDAAAPSPALAMEAAALQSSAAMAAELLGSMASPAPLDLATALAGLSRVDPSAELARLAAAVSPG